MSSPPASSKKTKRNESSPSPKKKHRPKHHRPSATSGILDYLRTTLPRPDLLELYQDDTRGRFVCRAVLQRLPETSQQLVIRLSCCGGSFPINMTRVWMKTPIDELLEELQSWAILLEDDDDNNNRNEETVDLTPQFYKGLRNSLQSLDVSPWHPLTPDQRLLMEQEATKVTGSQVTFPNMTTDDLEKYTQSQWDTVLHYLVGTPNLKVQPNPAVIHFLMQTNLMQPDPEFRGDNPEEAPLVITEKGYDFMLQDSVQQVWHFVVQYLQSMESHEKAATLKREALLVLICMSFARFGDCYSAASLSKDGRTIMKDLALFGLLYVKKVGKTSIFYPTRLAMQLVGSDGDKSSRGGGGGGMWSWSSKALDGALAHPTPHDSAHLAIIVQTNFQLAAYTTSELHVSMLGLFCDVQTIRRLPNVVFMTITRDSIKAAFNLGIKAQQVLRFLEKHAHPKLRQGNVSPIPPNIVDQVFLWDKERLRVQWREGFLHECLLPGEFHAVKKFAIHHDAHSWSNEGRNQLFLHYDQAETVQHFVRRWRAKVAARGS